MRVLFCFISCLFLTCCSTAVYDQVGYVESYREGDLFQAVDRVDEVVDTHMPEGRFTESLDAVWLFLDQATLHLIAGNPYAAISSYQLAIEAIDYYQQQAITEKMGQALVQDDVIAYEGLYFEKILARLYFALALDFAGDQSNAFALLQGAEQQYQLLKETRQNFALDKDVNVAKIAAARLVFACLLEKRGDSSNAAILYRDTGFCSAEPSDATLLIICHNGHVAHKKTSFCPAASASLLALELFMGGALDDSFSPTALQPVAVPQLVSGEMDSPCAVSVQLNQGPLEQMVPVTSVSEIAFLELEDRLPTIAARALARRLLRRSIVAVADQCDQGLGAFADFAMMIANSCTQADTRSWKTLPARIDALRYCVPKGEHTMSFLVGDQSVTQSIFVDKGDLCIINLWISKGCKPVVLIPDRFQGDLI